MDAAPPPPPDAQPRPRRARRRRRPRRRRLSRRPRRSRTTRRRTWRSRSARSSRAGRRRRSGRTSIVVDSSRSMIGERFARATRLASSIVREMDRRDSFVMLACDTVCRAMPFRSSRGRLGAGRCPDAPGRRRRRATSIASSGDRARRRQRPRGLDDGRAGGGRIARGKELRIIYLGDGTPTVGPTRAGAHRDRRPERDARTATRRWWPWRSAPTRT
jgi:hypothetical protein